jgi:Protein of unknown function (DUF2950)
MLSPHLLLLLSRGIMTFIVNHECIVFQKDLGSNPPNSPARSRRLNQTRPGQKSTCRDERWEGLAMHRSVRAPMDLRRLLAPGFLAFMALIPLTPSVAQEAGNEALSQDANDPTASLMTLQFADWYTSDFHNLPDADSNTVVFRPVLPFKLGGVNNILRATVPFITDSPFLDSGLSDATVFDLMVFNASWGRWGFGPVALLPTGGEDRGADKWAAGPAVGFTARSGNLL